MENVSLSKKLQKELKTKVEPESQKSSILKYLLAGYTITPHEALGRFGCFRLADVVWQLREEGHNIKTDLIKKSTGRGQYARYTLKKKK